MSTEDNKNAKEARVKIVEAQAKIKIAKAEAIVEMVKAKTKTKVEEVSQKGQVMTKIAIYVTTLVVIGTLVIAIIAIVYGFIGGKEEEDAMKYSLNFIAQTLLPLWGTWFGTILAFYFSKQNIDAVEKQNNELHKILSERDKKLASISVQDVMIPYSKIETLNIEEHGEKKLSEIMDRHFDRFPIFNNSQNEKLEFIVHGSFILKYASKQFNMEQYLKETNLHDFLKDEKVKAMLKDSAVFVSQNATLLNAKNAMEERKYCEDVFVTEDGEESSKVVGWITDNEIYKGVK